VYLYGGCSIVQRFDTLKVTWLARTTVTVRVRVSVMVRDGVRVRVRFSGRTI